MSYDKAGSPFHHPCKGILNLDLRSGVDGGGCLVQYEHGRKAQHHSGNTKQLFLALRQASSVLCNHRIIAIGKPLDEAVGMGLLGRLNDLLLRGFRLSHPYIVPDGSRPQPSLLKHHAVAGSQAPSGDIPDVRSVHLDGAAVHIIEPHQQIDHGGLAASGRPHDGHSLARPHLQIEVLYQLPIRHIGKMHSLQRHIALGVRQHPCPLLVRNLRLFVYQGKNPARAGQRVLQLRHHPRDLVEGLGILVGIAQKAGKPSHADAPPDGHEGSEDAHSRIDQTVHKAGGRIGDGGEENGL